MTDTATGRLLSGRAWDDFCETLRVAGHMLDRFGDEPTESEAKAELERFCDAMIAIRREISEVEQGRWNIEASPLRHAPHTVHDIADDNWSRAYSRADGCFPAGTSRSDKYWSPVGRVDNVYGDRNLVCSCPPIEDYAQAAE